MADLRRRDRGQGATAMSARAIPSARPSSHRPLPLGLFALANAGGVIAYLPLLTLLLPIKVEAIDGAGRIGLLSLIAICGAAAASLANILFGWLSDRTQRAGHGRRMWMGMGIVAIAASYGGFALATTQAALIAAILAFQLAVNALLAPMMAIMAEEIPDDRRGTAGGLLALGSPAASALSTLLVGSTMLGEHGRMAVLLGMSLILILPLMLTRARIMVPVEAKGASGPLPPRRDLVVAGLSRLSIQVAAIVTQVYLLYYFEAILPVAQWAALPRWIGQLFTIAFLTPLPIALILGPLADRTRRRKGILLAAALVATAGLVVMAWIGMGGIGADWRIAAVAFVVYTTGSSVFVALHAGLILQLLPDPRHRGRDLGLFNLTNTVPSIIGASLTWTFATPQDFTTVMVVLALMTGLGGLAILGVRTWE
ncbi:MULTISPECIES: MFS transporter [unclassified Sphingomonas]|uniref:MFS transporter n=1 Tax=unclassified Sphingomonas TaxID=196159 RepID=UPI00285E5B0A|nr:MULTISPECIES: MFS transporter [unclassified Sphingomonas]MDR6114442.1 MFS family permease [Sphingomonas sp. SORGH_AS_0789]MDR6148198.1 MFS family permease [Sphingomonas sp. SORGH_AS_0742]